MIFEVPYAFGWILLIIGVASVVTFFGYRKSKFDHPYRWLLPTLRFLSLVFLGLLLLNPAIRSSQTIEERPLLIWLQDESRSIIAGKDSAEYKELYFPWLENESERLEEKFELVRLGFDENVHSLNSNFNGTRSSQSSALREMLDVSAGRNMAGIVLASDGITNIGTPLTSVFRSTTPIHTLALGDSSQYSDIEIVDVVSNPVAYVGNSTPIQVEISASGGAVQRTTIDLYRNDDLIDSRVVTFNKGTATTRFEVGSDSSEVVQFKLNARPFEGEKNVANNSGYRRIEFLEKKRKISIIYQSPHPDISAFRLPLLEDDANEVELIEQDSWDLSEISDLYIFHGIRPDSRVAEVLGNQDVSILFITTPVEPYLEWSSLNDHLDNAPFLDRFTEVVPSVNPSFASFQVDEKWIEMLSSFPPMNAEIHAEENSGIWSPAFYADVRGVKTKTPLIGTTENEGQRFAWANGEGWWRLRTFSYAEYESHQPYDDFMLSMYRWLLTKPGKDRLEVDYPERVIQNEPIPFAVIPKNSALTFQSDAKVTLQLMKDGEVVFNQQMVESAGSRYVTTANGLPKGAYQYRVTSEFGDDKLSETGQLFVEEQLFELIDTKARYGMLSGLSARTGGLHASYADREQFIDDLMDLDTQIVLHESVETNSILNSWWPYILILLLFTAEWALRKREGSV